MPGDTTSDGIPEGQTDRRGMLRRIIGVGFLLVAGAAGILGWQFVTRPEVVDVDASRRSGTTLYMVTVRNNGGPGGVQIILRLRDENNTVLERREREITMEDNTERQLEFEVDPPEGTDDYLFQVQPTDFPERLVV